MSHDEDRDPRARKEATRAHQSIPEPLLRVQVELLISTLALIYFGRTSLGNFGKVLLAHASLWLKSFQLQFYFLALFSLLPGILLGDLWQLFLPPRCWFVLCDQLALLDYLRPEELVEL